MNMELLTVTFRGHFEWLAYSLRSVMKFARGFSGLTVALPIEETPAFHGLVQSLGIKLEFSITVRGYYDWVDKPMLCHEWQIMQSELLCPSADLICHIDSDCVFFEPVTPDTYLIDGKPVLMWSTFDWVCKRDGHEAYLNWKRAVENAIGGVCDRESMRRHPAVHWREIYAIARAKMVEHTGREPSEYIRAQHEPFPQGFCEFITLGEIAWRYFSERYYWVNQEFGPHPPDPIAQFWSKGRPQDYQDAQIRGQYEKRVIPCEMIERMLA